MVEPAFLDEQMDEVRKIIKFKAACETFKNEILNINIQNTGTLKQYLEIDPNISITTCEHCKGKGKIIRKHHKSKKKARKKCPVCRGVGQEIKYKIPDNVKYARRVEFGMNDHPL
jgi:DnaJ-class molecular chaperone